MKFLFHTFLLVSLVAPSSAFGVPRFAKGATSTTRSTHQVLYNSYLDSLSRPSTTTRAPSTESTTTLVYAPLTYFGLDQLTSKGPRTTADWGAPREATRKLADDGMLRGGSWWCSQGGWPSPNQKAHTEVFYVGKGHGCLSDADGVRHYFGPGDTVVIPKGHTGRWDVNEDIHKVWAVNAHDRIEERGTPIRVQVIHYQDYNQNHGTPQGYGTEKSECLYNVGPTQVGIWTAMPDSVVKVSGTKRVWFVVLEGALVVAGDDGCVQRCDAGDTVMLPEGWSGYIDVLQRVKKLWVQAD